MRTNPQIELAREFLSTTGANLFLTGRAGTGKTTFLRSVVQSINKRVVVAAPTGVAAINARGVTLHSLFQLPFGPNVPGVKRMDFAMRKMGAKKLALIRSIELLIIDEISMVRCDLLDAIDETLRQVRRSEAPFGGVQLLMIGDIEQLSPICRDEDWQLLHEHYNSPYFFDSHVLKRCNYITLTLTEIFRQSDSSFTELLNAVRENKISQEVVDKLNSRYIPNFEPRESDGYITLTTHNNTANNINSRELKQLPSTSHLFEAKVKGDYPEGAYPNDSSLELKVGAQVIFIKNDISTEKLYYNGLIGRIELIDG
ncbi:MAG: AAA family ATPase, partial [Rikenellaceae bacterium]